MVMCLKKRVICVLILLNSFAQSQDLLLRLGITNLSGGRRSVIFNNVHSVTGKDLDLKSGMAVELSPDSDDLNGLFLTFQPKGSISIEIDQDSAFTIYYEKNELKIREDVVKPGKVYFNAIDCDDKHINCSLDVSLTRQ
jgi:hypothetical protein